MCLHMAPRAADGDGGAAEAARDTVSHLRRHLQAGVPHRVFPRRLVALVAPGLIIGLGSFGGKDAPCGFEIGAGLLEGLRGAAEVLVRLAARIETAIPAPLVFIMGNARTDGDRATRTSPKLIFQVSRCASGSRRRVRAWVRVSGKGPSLPVPLKKTSRERRVANSLGDLPKIPENCLISTAFLGAGAP
jgi:hypothetical protein